MGWITDVVKFIQTHWADVANAIAYAIALASIIVKITPTKVDDGILDKIIAFIGKYIALNKNVPNSPN